MLKIRNFHLTFKISIKITISNADMSKAHNGHEAEKNCHDTPQYSVSCSGDGIKKQKQSQKDSIGA